MPSRSAQISSLQRLYAVYYTPTTMDSRLLTATLLFIHLKDETTANSAAIELKSFLAEVDSKNTHQSLNRMKTILDDIINTTQLDKKVIVRHSHNLVRYISIA